MTPPSKRKSPPEGPPLSTAAAKGLLRGAGLRCTAARVSVLQCLALAGVPLTHGEVAGRLADIAFDQSTIYRCLTEMADAGLLARLDLGDAVRRFELLGREKSSEHPHFFCVDCGKIQCLVDFTFRLSPRRGGAAALGRVTEVLVKGHCPQCG